MGKQTPKMSSRVVNAIRNLREAHGSTSKEIMNYIMSQCNVHESTVNRQVASLLRIFFFFLKNKKEKKTNFKYHEKNLVEANEYFSRFFDRSSFRMAGSRNDISS